MTPSQPSLIPITIPADNFTSFLIEITTSLCHNSAFPRPGALSQPPVSAPTGGIDKSFPRELKWNRRQDDRDAERWVFKHKGTVRWC